MKNKTLLQCQTFSIPRTNESLLGVRVGGARMLRLPTAQESAAHFSKPVFASWLSLGCDFELRAYVVAI